MLAKPLKIDGFRRNFAFSYNNLMNMCHFTLMDYGYSESEGFSLK